MEKQRQMLLGILQARMGTVKRVMQATSCMLTSQGEEGIIYKQDEPLGVRGVEQSHGLLIGLQDLCEMPELLA